VSHAKKAVILPMARRRLARRVGYTELSNPAPAVIRNECRDKGLVRSTPFRKRQPFVDLATPWLQKMTKQ